MPKAIPLEGGTLGTVPHLVHPGSYPSVSPARAWHAGRGREDRTGAPRVGWKQGILHVCGAGVPGVRAGKGQARAGRVWLASNLRLRDSGTASTSQPSPQTNHSMFTKDRLQRLKERDTSKKRRWRWRKRGTRCPETNS